MPDPLVTVAVFDTNQDTADMLATLLGQAGYHTVHAPVADASPEEAESCAFIAAHDPKVIIWDVSPPYDQNWAFFNAIRASGAFAGRGIVITTTHMSYLNVLLRSSPMIVDMLAKPYDLSLLLTGVKNAQPQPQPPAAMA